MAYNSQFDASIKNQLIKDLKQFQAFLKEEIVKKVIDLELIQCCKEEIKIRKQKLGIKNIK